MSHPFTDIVIPVHDAFDYLKPCIETLYQNTENFRLIIVDDFSFTPQAEEFCRYIVTKDPNNLLVRTNKQKWFTRASNIGLRLSRTPNVVLLNSDCVLNEGWLEELYGCGEEFLRDNPKDKLGIVGAVLWLESPVRYKAVYEPEYVTGHALMFNRNAMEELATRRGTPGWWLNELERSQIHINSDRIVCYDLNRIGYKTIISYHCPIGHHGGKSWSYDLGTVGNLKLSDVD